MNTRTLAVALLLPLAVAGGAAEARDCAKGAVVGGVAGHFAGRHSVLGAAAGCAIAHHRAKVKDRDAARAAAQTQNTPKPPANAPARRTTTL